MQEENQRAILGSGLGAMKCDAVGPAAREVLWHPEVPFVPLLDRRLAAAQPRRRNQPSRNVIA